MWSKSVNTLNFKGDFYPDDIDAEKAGTVFILTRNGITETVSKKDYEAWLSETMGGAAEMKILYKPLNDYNIKKF